MLKVTFSVQFWTKILLVATPVFRLVRFRPFFLASNAAHVLSFSKGKVAGAASDPADALCSFGILQTVRHPELL